jgi:hypothetical protein
MLHACLSKGEGLNDSVECGRMNEDRKQSIKREHTFVYLLELQPYLCSSQDHYSANGEVCRQCGLMRC